MSMITVPRIRIVLNHKFQVVSSPPDAKMQSILRNADYAGYAEQVAANDAYDWVAANQLRSTPATSLVRGLLIN